MLIDIDYDKLEKEIKLAVLGQLARIEYIIYRSLELTAAKIESSTLGVFLGTSVQNSPRARKFPGGVSRMQSRFNDIVLGDAYASKRKTARYPYKDHSGFLSSSANVYSYLMGTDAAWPGFVVIAEFGELSRVNADSDYYEWVDSYVERKTGRSILDIYTGQILRGMKTKNKWLTSYSAVSALTPSYDNRNVKVRYNKYRGMVNNISGTHKIQDKTLKRYGVR